MFADATFDELTLRAARAQHDRGTSELGKLLEQQHALFPLPLAVSRAIGDHDDRRAGRV